MDVIKCNEFHLPIKLTKFIHPFHFIFYLYESTNYTPRSYPQDGPTFTLKHHRYNFAEPIRNYFCNNAEFITLKHETCTPTFIYEACSIILINKHNIVSLKIYLFCVLGWL